MVERADKLENGYIGVRGSNGDLIYVSAALVFYFRLLRLLKITKKYNGSGESQSEYCCLTSECKLKCRCVESLKLEMGKNPHCLSLVLFWFYQISGFVRFGFFPATEKWKFGSGSVLCAESSVLFCSVLCGLSNKHLFKAAQVREFKFQHMFLQQFTASLPVT